MAGKDAAGNASAEPRRLWRVVRAVLYMMRRGVPSGRKLAMDLHVLLRRGKIAGKSLGGLASFHHRHAAVRETSRGCREVEFSCRNTQASSALFAGGPLGATERRHHGEDVSTGHYNYDEADIARMFEMLNDNGHLFDDDMLTAATPSPVPSSFGRSPVARQMRITDSPFAASEKEQEQEQVDVKADEFIRRFYEQLRAQKSVPATPNYYGGYATTAPYNGHSARSVAAGMA